MDYLLKTEASTYSFADLQRDKNHSLGRSFQSRCAENLRSNEAGERLIIYETGDRKSAVRRSDSGFGGRVRR